MLRGYRSFSKVISNGKSLFANPVRCYFVYDAGAETRTNIGFAVTRNVGKSSERNHIKRRMREAVRLDRHLLQEPTLPGGSLDIVFLYVGDREATRISLKPIRTAIATLLARVRRELLANRL
ncbi:MAG: ribonuclease P protein component [Ignavibacteriales bacterium]|nr:ribonuclease P protein component [Ignavibacteriales bacterium]